MAATNSDGCNQRIYVAASAFVADGKVMLTIIKG